MSTRTRRLSRRGLLKRGALAASAGAALLAPSAVSTLSAQAPAVITRRRFKGWISRGAGTGRTTLHELTLRPITGRQVVVRALQGDVARAQNGSTHSEPVPHPD